MQDNIQKIAKNFAFFRMEKSKNTETRVEIGRDIVYNSGSMPRKGKTPSTTEEYEQKEGYYGQIRSKSAGSGGCQGAPAGCADGL
ncbi:MAG: hypothetical protein IKA78_01605 [Oscillospiraceae bacterium]|nr:hypothetical protein [Oscillospiraceae bacterium]MBR2365846.1 hypothetical protein [Oscillospiraceae bacterium]